MYYMLGEFAGEYRPGRQNTARDFANYESAMRQSNSVARGLALGEGGWDIRVSEVVERTFILISRRGVRKRGREKNRETFPDARHGEL